MKIKKGEEVIIDQAERTNTLLGKIRGLMFRSIEEEEGLLFIFDKVSEKSIWMPFVPQNISVFFIDKEKNVVDKVLARKITFKPFTWKIYKSQDACKYVLECHENKFGTVDVGDKLNWDNDE